MGKTSWTYSRRYCLTLTIFLHTISLKTLYYNFLFNLVIDALHRKTMIFCLQFIYYL